MRERLRGPRLKHPSGTKTLIVAGCAAIAMIMGAMSAGASIFNHADERPATAAEVSSVVNADSPGLTNGRSPATGDLGTEQTLKVIGAKQHATPLYVIKDGTKSEQLLGNAFSATMNRLSMSSVPLLRQLQDAAPEPSATSKSEDTGAHSGTLATAPGDPGPPMEPTPEPASPGEPSAPSDTSSPGGSPNTESTPSAVPE